MPTLTSTRPLGPNSPDFMERDLDLNPQESTGFKENYGAALGLTIDEELTISSSINAPDYKPRNEELYSLIKEGKLPGHEAYIDKQSPNTIKYNWNNLARYAKKQGFSSIQEDSEILNDKRSEMASRRRYAEDIMDNANIPGITGMVTGFLHGGVVDPVNIVAATLGPIAFGRYIGSMGSVYRVMAVEGAIGAGAEVAIAPFVHEWKETMGVEYTIDDVLVNMAASGALNAGIGGLAEWTGQMIKAANKAGLDTTPLQLSKEEFERLADEFGPDADPESLLRQMDQIEKEMVGPRQPQGTTVEAEDVIIPGQDREPDMVGELPQDGFVVANKGTDGKIYIGKKGEIHAHLYEQYASEIEQNLGKEFDDEKISNFFEEQGFIGPEGRYLTRKEAFEMLGKDDAAQVKPGELDSLELPGPDVKEPDPSVTHFDSDFKVGQERNGENILISDLPKAGEELPSINEFAPAIVGADGKLYVGFSGEDHFSLIGKHSETIEESPNFEGYRYEPGDNITGEWYAYGAGFDEHLDVAIDAGFVDSNGKYYTMDDFITKSGKKSDDLEASYEVVVENPRLEVDSPKEPELPDVEIYVSVDEGLEKVKARDLDQQIDELIKYIDNTKGVPVCGG